jgi:multiple RNA-binding domain-containing protein 1
MSRLKHSNEGNVHSSLPSNSAPHNGHPTTSTRSNNDPKFQPHVPIRSLNERKRKLQNELNDECSKPTPAVNAAPATPKHENGLRKSSANEGGVSYRSLERAKPEEKKERRVQKADIGGRTGIFNGHSKEKLTDSEVELKKMKAKLNMSRSQAEDVVLPGSETSKNGLEIQDKKEKKKKRKKNREDSTIEVKSHNDQADNLSRREELREGTNSSSQVDGDTKGGVKPIDDDISESPGQSADQKSQQRRNPGNTSDDDWLRARTSRLLDLIDESPQNVSSAFPESEDGRKKTEANQEAEDTEMLGTSSIKSSTTTPNSSYTSGRLFVRNLPYTACESDIEALFSKYGQLDEVRPVKGPLHLLFHDDRLIGTAYASQLMSSQRENFSRYLLCLINSPATSTLTPTAQYRLTDSQVHLLRDKAGSSKGIAYVHFPNNNVTRHVLEELDGKSFQGRLLHILEAADKKSHKLNDYEMSKLPLKRQKALKRKMEAGGSSFSWNSMYMNPNAVLSSIADRLGVAKAELIDVSSSDAAVKQAHAETHVIQETKAFLASNGVNLDAFRQNERDERTVLVKNFPFGTTADDLKSLFGAYGEIVKFLLAPSGTSAIIQYAQPGEGVQAIRHLAYRNLKGSVLYLEKAPKNLFGRNCQPLLNKTFAGEASTSHEDSDPRKAEGSTSCTLFVRNLNFTTTSSRLTNAFKPLSGFLSARVKTKIDPRKPQEILSMGFGFVEFSSNQQAQAALAAMNGSRLDDYELIVQVSHKSTDAAENQRIKDNLKKAEAHRTKIIIKNLPFEATKKDVRALLSAYGQLRSIKLPQKFDRSTRGFSFADFVTAKEAENVIEALKDTHLLGRRLVLEFADEECIDPEDEIRAIESKVGRQTEIIQVKKITGSGRKKFNIGTSDHLR